MDNLAAVPLQSQLGVAPDDIDARSLDTIAKVIVTLAIAFLGFFGCSQVGSLVFNVGGIGQVVGGVVGAVLFGLCTCMLLGLWKVVIPNSGPRLGVGALLPHKLAEMMDKHGNFTLLLTVHEANGVRVQSVLPYMSADLYVEITCGVNPVKRTVVKHDKKGSAKWNEQFRLNIRAVDDCIVLRIRDQDVFGSSAVGHSNIGIQRHIIRGENRNRTPFPQKCRFPISGDEEGVMMFGEKDAHIVLSFDYTDDYPDPIQYVPEGEGAPVEDARARGVSARIADNEKSMAHHGTHDSYGAVHFLSKVQFDPAAKYANAIGTTAGKDSVGAGK